MVNLPHSTKSIPINDFSCFLQHCVALYNMKEVGSQVVANIATIGKLKKFVLWPLFGPVLLQNDLLLQSAPISRTSRLAEAQVSWSLDKIVTDVFPKKCLTVDLYFKLLMFYLSPFDLPSFELTLPCPHKGLK